MKTKLKKRAISTILTTVIILVASVVLGSGVVLYGTSLFQGSTLQESIAVSGVKLWIDPTENPDGHAWGAVGVRNTGDKIVAFDKISVRGVDIPFTSWFATTNQTQASVENTQASFPHSGFDGTAYGATGEMANSATLSQATPGLCTNALAADQIIIDVDGLAGGAPSMCLVQQTGPISLSPGDRAVVYFQLINGTLAPIDAGAQTSVNLFAGKTGAPLSLTVATP